MAINKSDITERLLSLKEWQENNVDKIHSDSHLEGYNSAVNSEILFLEQLLDKEPSSKTVKKK
jgi:hypothetical protein